MGEQKNCKVSQQIPVIRSVRQGSSKCQIALFNIYVDHLERKWKQLVYSTVLPEDCNDKENIERVSN